MKKKLVIIENDPDLKGKLYIQKFLRTFVGEVVELCKFFTLGRKEIFDAVSTCTDIAVQTCFTGGSDQQLHSMVALLAKIPHSINIHLGYVGLSHSGELEEYLVNELSLEEIVSIRHHKIYNLNPYQWECGHNDNVDYENYVLRFEEVLKPYNELELYRLSAKTRPTGRKIKILACNGFGKMFENLPIGEVVDELECSKLLKLPARGVWVWGNGEPIILVNDQGPREYEIVDTKLSLQEIVIEIMKFTECNELTNDQETIESIKETIKEHKDKVFLAANTICEILDIEKRKNRGEINQYLSKHIDSLVF